jgi:hypothetical protein
VSGLLSRSCLAPISPEGWLVTKIFH